MNCHLFKFCYVNKLDININYKILIYFIFGLHSNLNILVCHTYLLSDYQQYICILDELF